MTKQHIIKMARETMNPLQLRSLGRAIDYATTMHSNQKRASGEDYIEHPLAVAAILLDWHQGAETVIAGVLHDTIEDTDSTLTEIEKKFGKRVAFLVDGVTKVTAVRSGMRIIDSYLPQTTNNLSKLLLAVGQDARVIIIKLADRLHNLRTLQYLPKDKQLKIAAESLAIFARLADRLGMGKVRVEIEELSFSYIEPRRYKYLKKLTKKRVGKAHSRIEKIKSEISQQLTKEHVKHSIDGRIKSIYSLHKKLAKYDEDINEIYDLLALRIIVKDTASCYRVLGVIHDIYQPVLHKIKDYIATPKANGYQSLHTTVITPEKQIVELQIRSQKMHNYAENGLAASFHYNEQKLTKNYLLRRKAAPSSQYRNWISGLEKTAHAIRDGTSIDDLKIDIFGDRIFVHSPKGDIYDLPEGAYPLDYAYAVHSDIGQHAQTFIINGNIGRFSQVLQNGDTIEVRTSKKASPKNGWLRYTKTARARQRIKTSINESSTASKLG